jgi:hypothetical protein
MKLPATVKEAVADAEVEVSQEEAAQAGSGGRLLVCAREDAIRCKDSQLITFFRFRGQDT